MAFNGNYKITDNYSLPNVFIRLIRVTGGKHERFSSYFGVYPSKADADALVAPISVFNGMPFPYFPGRDPVAIAYDVLRLERPEWQPDQQVSDVPAEVAAWYESTLVVEPPAPPEVPEVTLTDPA